LPVVVAVLRIVELEAVALVVLELLLEHLVAVRLLKENCHYCQHSPTQLQLVLVVQATSQVLSYTQQTVVILYLAQ
jgi:hypothetical protein